MARKSLSSVLAVSFFSVFISIPSSNGYASWIKCFVQLNDPDAVVMHHHIVPAEHARFNITLRAWMEISSLEGEEVEKTARPSSSPTLGPSRKISLPTQRSSNGTLEYVYNNPGTVVQIKLDASKAPRDVQQRIQYVLDITQGENSAQDDESAHFIPPQDRRVVCKGKRVIGPSSNVIHTLTLYGDSVEVVAGWATEHEAVTLTDSLKFRYQHPNPLIAIAEDEPKEVLNAEL